MPPLSRLLFSHQVGWEARPNARTMGDAVRCFQVLLILQIPALHKFLPTSSLEYKQSLHLNIFFIAFMAKITIFAIDFLIMCFNSHWNMFQVTCCNISMILFSLLKISKREHVRVIPAWFHVILKCFLKRKRKRAPALGVPLPTFYLSLAATPGELLHYIIYSPHSLLSLSQITKSAGF